MFSFFKKKPPVLAPAAVAAPPAAGLAYPPAAKSATPAVVPMVLPVINPVVNPVVEPDVEPSVTPPARSGWLSRLAQGLRKTGSGLSQVFTGTRIDEALYEELESALLMADTGVAATEYLLSDLRRRVKQAKAGDPAGVKALLADALSDLLMPLQRPLSLGVATPTVIMVVGVNGAGKIGRASCRERV